MERVPLYEGAENKSYYKFIQEIHSPTEEEISRAKASVYTKHFDTPSFENRSVIQTDEYTPVPEGIYLKEDGTAFVSIITPVPDMTGEMLEWFMVWHQLDDLRYALWNPEDHYGEKISEESRRRILNQSIPIRERIWGVDCTVIESMNGEKPMTDVLHFVEPGSVGLKNELIGTPKCQAIIVANNTLKIGPINYPVFMCEFIRENDEGKNDWVIAAWMGHGVKDGKDITVKLPKLILKKMASGMPAMLQVHSHKEVGHLNKILPALYAEQKDNWEE